MTTPRFVLALLAGLTPTLALANPEGSVVTHGEALFTPNGNTLSIEQLSDRAIIDWESFSISAGEITRFIQPSSSSAVLNRVISGNPSAIHGQLQANGQVILVNPNGVLVGPAGQIDAGGGFIASTLALREDEFLAGGDLTFSGDSLAAVSNLGTIVAAEGNVFLIAAGSVSNAGTIEAPNGTAGLAAGAEVVVQSEGDERILVKVGSASAAVDHSGTIQAAQAELRAAGGSAESLAINVSGLIEVTGVQRKGGRVMLTGDTGSVAVSGRISAKTDTGEGGVINVDSGAQTAVTGQLDASGGAGMGGSVAIAGDTISLDGTALVDVSGASGGQILIGGGLAADDPGFRRATSTTIGAGATLNASGTGAGGQVVVRGSDLASVAGAIDASGGQGDGGLVRIDSAGETTLTGAIIASSDSGTGGRVEVTGDRLLLDGAALIDASGDTGGEIFVGGGYQGNDPTLRNAQTTTIGAGVILRVNAIGAGNAGQAIVWADDTTRFHGHIDASAAGDGDGGFVEVSGKQDLFYRGSVDLGSVGGDSGSLLLDPDTVIIIDGAAGGAPNSGELGDGEIEVGDGGPGSTFTITTGDIAAINGDVTIAATNTITDNGAALTINAGGEISFGADSGDINLTGSTINAPGFGVNIVAGGNLNFNEINSAGAVPGESGGDVFLGTTNGNISGNQINAGGATGAAGADGGDGGSVVMIDLAGGNLIQVQGIDNPGGTGGVGDSANTGGDGGDGGLVSVGNNDPATPSSVIIPTIVYNGGDGGAGNPPGGGGTGGSLFVNNGTLTPNNTAPGGAPGADLAVSPPVSAPPSGDMGVAPPLPFEDQTNAIDPAEQIGDAIDDELDALGGVFGFLQPQAFIDRLVAREFQRELEIALGVNLLGGTDLPLGELPNEGDPQPGSTVNIPDAPALPGLGGDPFKFPRLGNLPVKGKGEKNDNGVGVGEESNSRSSSEFAAGLKTLLGVDRAPVFQVVEIRGITAFQVDVFDNIVRNDRGEIESRGRQKASIFVSETGEVTGFGSSDRKEDYYGTNVLNVVSNFTLIFPNESGHTFGPVDIGFGVTQTDVMQGEGPQEDIQLRAVSEEFSDLPPEGASNPEVMTLPELGASETFTRGTALPLFQDGPPEFQAAYDKLLEKFEEVRNR